MFVDGRPVLSDYIKEWELKQLLQNNFSLLARPMLEEFPTSKSQESHGEHFKHLHKALDNISKIIVILFSFLNHHT